MAPRLGSGGRFKALTRGGMSPGLAAWIGRNKYGAKKMAAMSAAGRRRKTTHRRKRTHRHRR
jgi:hypothetical protein